MYAFVWSFGTGCACKRSTKRKNWMMMAMHHKRCDEMCACVYVWRAKVKKIDLLFCPYRAHRIYVKCKSMCTLYICMRKGYINDWSKSDDLVIFFSSSFFLNMYSKSHCCADISHHVNCLVIGAIAFFPLYWTIFGVHETKSWLDWQERKRERELPRARDEKVSI